jgi:hypothetical protein
MATTSLIFSSPLGSTPLAAGRNQIASIAVGEYASIRLYAFVRPSTPQVTLYLINPDLYDHVGTDPVAGALDTIVMDALQGQSRWYPLPGLNLSIQAFTSGAGGIDLYVYGQK